MIDIFPRVALAAFVLVLAATPSHAQSRDPATEPRQPPTIIVPPKPAPAPLPPAGTTRPAEPRAEFCCTPYGRFGPVGGGGRPGAPCQWTLPGSVAQGSTCN